MKNTNFNEIDQNFQFLKSRVPYCSSKDIVIKQESGKAYDKIKICSDKT